MTDKKGDFDRNLPMSYGESGGLDVKAVGKWKTQSGKLAEETRRIAKNNLSMGVILKLLNSGEISEKSVARDVKSKREKILGFPRMAGVAALAKFREDKKPKPKEAKKKKTPSSTVRKGGEFAIGGPIGYSQRWKTGREG